MVLGWFWAVFSLRRTNHLTHWATHPPDHLVRSFSSCFSCGLAEFEHENVPNRQIGPNAPFWGFRLLSVQPSNLAKNPSSGSLRKVRRIIFHMRTLTIAPSERPERSTGVRFQSAPESPCEERSNGGHHRESPKLARFGRRHPECKLMDQTKRS